MYIGLLGKGTWFVSAVESVEVCVRSIILLLGHWTARGLGRFGQGLPLSTSWYALSFMRAAKRKERIFFNNSDSFKETPHEITSVFHTGFPTVVRTTVLPFIPLNYLTACHSNKPFEKNPAI